MSTLTDICMAADVPVHTCVDDATPAGHFIATTRILGVTASYLCAGVLDDPQAPIVGRIEYGAEPGDRVTVVRGAGIKGGTWLTGVADEVEAFQAMVNGSTR